MLDEIKYQGDRQLKAIEDQKNNFITLKSIYESKMKDANLTSKSKKSYRC